MLSLSKRRSALGVNGFVPRATCDGKRCETGVEVTLICKALLCGKHETNACRSGVNYDSLLRLASGTIWCTLWAARGRVISSHSATDGTHQGKCIVSRHEQ